MGDSKPIRFVGPKFQPDDPSGRDPLLGLFAMAAGAVLLGSGLFFFITAHPADPTPVVGTVSSYREGNFCARCWWDPEVEITLTGRSQTYYLAERDFPPESLQFSAGMTVTLWVDRGTSKILALSEAGQQFASKSYTDPNHQLVQDRLEAGVIMVGGVLCLLSGIALTAGWRLA